MTLDDLYELRDEYERDPALKQRLGAWYVQTVEERIAEEEAKANPVRDPAREERYRKHVLAGRIIDPEYLSAQKLSVDYDVETAQLEGWGIY